MQDLGFMKSKDDNRTDCGDGDSAAEIEAVESGVQLRVGANDLAKLGIRRRSGVDVSGSEELIGYGFVNESYAVADEDDKENHQGGRVGHANEGGVLVRDAGMIEEGWG